MSNPIFQATSRHPLGKGFPVGGSGTAASAPGSRSAGPPAAPSTRPRSHGISAASRDKSVQNEFIRNLQQQIYLLELETRYLRSGNGSARGQAGQPGSLRHGLQPYGSKHSLHGSIGALNADDGGYEDEMVNEVEKSRQDLTKAKDEYRKLELSLATVQKDKDELLQDIKSLKDRHATEKDKIYGELIATKKKYDTAVSETQRVELSYKRVVQEKEWLEGIASEARGQFESMKEQVDEQLQINENLRARIDELLQANLTANARLKETDAIVAGFRIEDTNARMHALEEEVKSLTSKAKQMEQERQQMDYLKKKTDEDMRDLIKQNVDLVQQRDEIKRTLAKERKDLQDRGKEQDASKEETDQRRHELSRLKDDLGMLRISNDNKDRKISELHQQIKTNESANNKNIEARILLAERVSELENRLRTNELELIQVGQDKSLLMDDVAELKNQLDLALHKLASLTATNNGLILEVETHKRDLKEIQEFATVLEKVETNGQHHLQLMRDMRKYLDHRQQ